ncbi:MAG: DUF362 domain-containing protein [Candidatus Lokiarchaeota archaeon]|nr:DUF362 domain-containing protein [Candidatus Lokiarchaeota archaeon]
MNEESIVYWAPPIEFVALKNTKSNMISNNLIKTRLILEKILDNIKPGDKVGVKVHVGEAYNTRYLRHDYVHEVVDFITQLGAHPTLIETQGLGMRVQHIKMSDEHVIRLGLRKTGEEHRKIAHLHGYNESIIGAPLKFIDGEKGIDREIVSISGLQLNEVSVAAGLLEFDKIVVISHFKGHGAAGFGGALKQLGIGCVTKTNKFRAHFDKLEVTKNCDPSKCGSECIEACPINAIKIEDGKAIINREICLECTACMEKCKTKRAISSKWILFDSFAERFIDNALGVVTSIGPENFRYINFAFDITLNCDCVSNPSTPIVPDLGIYGSKDPVAIDKACIDAEINAPGVPMMNDKGNWKEPIKSGVDKFSALLPTSNYKWQIDAAVKNRLGTTNYKLIKI